MFTKSIEDKGQTISFCGVGAHHQNGIAEKRIGDLQSNAWPLLCQLCTFTSILDSMLPTMVWDVARVIDGTEEQRIFVTLNGKNAVRVSVQKQPNANTIAVVEGVKKRITELKKSGLMTGGIQVVTTTDESVFIQNAVNNVVSSGLAGTILAGLTVFVFPTLQT